MTMNWKLSACLAAVAVLAAGRADAAMRITEWMYNGLGAEGDGEYIEFTNLGVAPVDMTGWSFDDNSRTPGSQSLSGFGTLAPGESAILAEATDTAFRTEWSLAPTVKVVGGNTNNLGRSDEINLYDASNALVDRLTYGDQDFAGSIRTQNVSGNPIAFSDLGANNVARWVLSVDGDGYGSRISATGDIGNPGFNAVVPEPATLSIAAVGVAALAARRRRP